MLANKNKIANSGDKNDFICKQSRIDLITALDFIKSDSFRTLSRIRFFLTLSQVGLPTAPNTWAFHVMSFLWKERVGCYVGDGRGTT